MWWKLLEKWHNTGPYFSYKKLFVFITTTPSNNLISLIHLYDILISANQPHKILTNYFDFSPSSKRWEKRNHHNSIMKILNETSQIKSIIRENPLKQYKPSHINFPNVYKNSPNRSLSLWIERSNAAHFKPHNTLPQCLIVNRHQIVSIVWKKLIFFGWVVRRSVGY